MSENTLPPTPEDPYYSVETIAEMFDVEPYTVRNWIRQDKLKAIKVLGRWRVRKSEVVRLVNDEHG